MQKHLRCIKRPLWWISTEPPGSCLFKGTARLLLKFTSDTPMNVDSVTHLTDWSESASEEQSFKLKQGMRSRDDVCEHVKEIIQ